MEKVKAYPSYGQMQTKENVGVSQKTFTAVRVPADSPERTQSCYSDTIIVSVSSHHGDKNQFGFQVNLYVDIHPKVSRASRFHFLSPEELNSILYRVTRTLKTQVSLQGPFSETLAKTE